MRKEGFGIFLKEYFIREYKLMLMIHIFLKLKKL